MPEIPPSVWLLVVGALLVTLGGAMLQKKTSLIAKGLSLFPLLGGVYVLIDPKFNLLPGLVNSKLPGHVTSSVYAVIWVVWGMAILVYGLSHKSVTGIMLGLLILVIGVAPAFDSIDNFNFFSIPGKILDGVSNIIEGIMKNASKNLPEP